MGENEKGVKWGGGDEKRVQAGWREHQKRVKMNRLKKSEPRVSMCFFALNTNLIIVVFVENRKEH